MGVSKDELLDTPVHYHEFTIKKKSGKPRQLAAPNSKLKSLQRKLLRRVFKKLKASGHATGFEQGISFVDNARCHQSQAVVIRFDMIDFFPSISSDAVEQYFRRIGWNRKASRLLTSLTTYKGALPQGAPTSPRLSNLINLLFDYNLAKLAKTFGAVYTRYADDITLSVTENVDVAELVGRTATFIKTAGYEPHIKKKFDVRRAHQRQVVTGLVVNEVANLPREKRRWLRAVEHRMKLKKAGGYVGPQPTLTEEELNGWRSLRKMIDNSSLSDVSEG